MCGGYKKGENPSERGKNKIQWITNFTPAGLRGRVILGKGNEVTIGDRIKRIRKKRRLTQAELAMMSGLSLSAIQGYEQGRYEPKRKSIESIAEVFKIPVDELYDMPAELSTNLAEVGTDAVSRKAVKELAYSQIRSMYCGVALKEQRETMLRIADNVIGLLAPVTSAQPEIIYCKDCKHNPKYEWFGCPMSHLSEKQRPETAWCWKAERRTDERSD